MTGEWILKINKKNISIKKLPIIDLLCILMGIFVTTPIITLKISGRHISIFTILFFLFLGYMLIDTLKCRKNVKFGYMTKLYAMWFYIALISSVSGLLYFSSLPDWSSSVYDYMPKIVMYLSILIMVAMSEKKEEIIHSILKGFLIGCVLNISWAIIEGLVYYVFHFSLNNLVFADYAKTLPADRQFITILTAHGIRTPGFNYDPAHLGGIIPIIILYSAINRRYFLIVLSGIAIIFSQSTTALVCSIILLVINFKIFQPRIKKKVFSKKFAAAGIIIILVIIAGSVFTNIQIIQSIKINLIGFFDRVTSVYINNQKTGIRTLYLLYVPIGIIFNGIKVITGTGFGTASFPYVFSSNIRTALGINSIWAYDPENTYISYLFDVGIIGLIIYVVVLYKNYQYYSNKWKDKEKSLILASLGGIIFSGFFYHYTLTAYQVIILIMSTVLMDAEKEKPH